MEKLNTEIARESLTNTTSNPNKIVTIDKHIPLKDIIFLSDETSLTPDEILNSKKSDIDSSHEAWKPIPSFNGLYEASSLGRIRRSSDKFIYCTNVNVQNGYVFVRLMFDGLKGYSYVHRLVAEAFYGKPCDNRVQVDHLNGNRHDNRLANLEWVSRKENVQRMIIRRKKNKSMH